MKFTIAAVISAVAASAYAQVATGPTAGVGFAHPSYSDVVSAGNTFNISWYPIAGAVDASKNINSIALMSGSSNALDTVIPNILPGPIPTSPSWYMWNIPLDVATMPSYSLALKGDNGADSYSTYFVIMAAAPGAKTNYTAAPPTTSSPGAGSGNGSTSGSGSAPSTTEESAATSLKAGLFGAGIAGVVALLI
ncbi:hypothetical protein EDC94DRAFT_625037 [Helicostylum pulchrum]|uniref:Uncharacterized protein n=1 Tax=Helicostylum pulchrum TaxID=562976 RepID=A0ABP9YCA5_9FUNG|nr:hypothetical protein EDC94DRAFT_625037 [Helicostylum pulchrum]